MEAFSNLDVHENKLDLNGLKFRLKSVYGEDFAKQASSTQQVAEIKRKPELNQTLAKSTKLLCLVLTIFATSTSCKRSFSSLKRINNHMGCS